MQPKSPGDTQAQPDTLQATRTADPSIDALQVERAQLRPGTKIDPSVTSQATSAPSQRAPGYTSQSQPQPRPQFGQQVRTGGNSEDDDYAAASYSAASYAKEIRAKRPTSKHNWRWLLFVIAVLLVAGGAYWFMNRPKTKPVNNPSAQNAKAQNQAPKTLINSTTKTYNSSQFTGISFSYPADWKVTETSGSNMLTAVSPAISLKTATNQTESVAVVYKIRAKQQTLPEFSQGAATAVLESQKISYTNPTQNQRAQTYVSFLQYATTTAPGVDGIYVTGDAGYQAQQVVPKADFASLDPIISVTFVKCTAGSTTCTPTSQAVTLATGDWNNAQFSGPIEKLLESLVAQ